MAAAAHNPQFAKKVGIPQEVAQEFNQADAKAAASHGVDKAAIVTALRQRN
jgi:hypothetical protein